MTPTETLAHLRSKLEPKDQLRLNVYLEYVKESAADSVMDGVRRELEDAIDDVLYRATTGRRRAFDAMAQDKGEPCEKTTS
jgi:hypothetical protein